MGKLSIDESRDLVLREVSRSLRTEKLRIELDTVLMGESGVLDSIILIELCVGLEDRSSELGFEFDWTSDVAMSKSRSMFSTVESLAQEFHNQFLASQ
jgi:acyl carrier protein